MSHTPQGVDRLLIRPARYARQLLEVGVGQITGKTPNRVNQHKGHDTTTSSTPETASKRHPPHSHNQHKGQGSSPKLPISSNQQHGQGPNPTTGICPQEVGNFSDREWRISVIANTLSQTAAGRQLGSTPRWSQPKEVADGSRANPANDLPDATTPQPQRPVTHIQVGGSNTSSKPICKL